MSKEPVKQDKVDEQAEQQRREQAQRQGGDRPAEYTEARNRAQHISEEERQEIDRRQSEDPLYIEHTRPEDPSGRPGQLTRDNVNPNIPSGPKDRVPDECGRVDPNAGGIVDPTSLGMPQGGVAPKMPEEIPPGGLRSESINEPTGSNVLGKTEADIPPEILAQGKPTISGLEPAEAVSGDPDFTLVVSGTNFFAGSVIVFGTQDEPTTFDEEAGTLSTGVKPSLFAPATVPVKIRNGPLVSDPSDFVFTGPVADDQETDPDELEDEIDQMKEDGDISSSRKPKRKR